MSDMDLQHINIKLYLEGALAVDPGRFIEVFHQWIQDDALDEMLIDVADYRHVPNGPGVLLVGHHADYSMDQTAGRWGLRYNRKAAVDGSNVQRLEHAFRAAVRAADLLEQRFADGPLQFDRREFALWINDRALAANTPEAFAQTRPEIAAFIEQVLGQSDFKLEHDSRDPRRLLGMTVRLARPFDLAALRT